MSIYDYIYFIIIFIYLTIAYINSLTNCFLGYNCTLFVVFTFFSSDFRTYFSKNIIVCWWLSCNCNK